MSEPRYEQKLQFGDRFYGGFDKGKFWRAKKGAFENYEPLHERMVCLAWHFLENAKIFANGDILTWKVKFPYNQRTLVLELTYTEGYMAANIVDNDEQFAVEFLIY